MKIIKMTIAAVAVLLAASCGPIHKVSTLPAELPQYPAEEQHGKIAVVAHRGFWKCDAAGHSENSIASLREAQNHGFWGSEFDVQLTSDDVIIVNHDDTIDGKLIWDHPYSAFASHRLPNGEKVSTLDEYLTQGEKSRKTKLILEFKEQKNEARENLMVDKAFAMLKAHNLYDPKRVVFISFSLNICKKVAAEAPEFVNQYLNGELSPTELKKLGINGMDYAKKVLNQHPDYVGLCQYNGMSSNVWTVNSDKEINTFIDMGVGAITTNEPLRVRELLGKGREFRK